MKISFDTLTLLASKSLNKVSGIFLLLLLGITFVNVIMRYFFNNPIAGTYELTELIMAIICLSAFAHATEKKSHVIVTVLSSRLSVTTQSILEAIVYLVTLGISFLLTWKTFNYAASLQKAGEYSGALHIPIAPFVYLLILGFALMFLVFLKQFLCILYKTFKLTSVIGRIGFIFGIILVSLSIVFFSFGNSLPLQFSPISIGVISIILLLVFIFLGMPVGFAMVFIGFLGIAYLRSLPAAFDIISRVPYGTISSYGLSVAPLFMLMGHFAFQAGLSQKLYESVYKWMGHFPGGLAMATIGACTGFAAITGSSLATAATMGTVAYPEMKKYNYDPKLATGCIASGGPIAAMIPPSILFILYAISTEQSIGELFISGILPGLLICVVFMITIYLQVKYNPTLGPRGPKTSFKEKLVSLKDIWMIIVLFVIIIGGIYTGVFTAIEAGGIGAFGALVFSLIKKGLTWKTFMEALTEVSTLTAMLFIIVIGANILGYLLAASRLPFIMADVASNMPMSPYAIMIIIIVIYLILGTFLDSIAMVLLTVPIFFPLVTTLGFDPIWFGVIVVLACETGLITPPVGMTVYVLSSVVKDVPTFTIFKGTLPFVIANLAIMMLLLYIPQIATFLPQLMRG